MALFGRQAHDNRSIVGQQSFITLNVDRLSIDTWQEDQTEFVYRLSTDRQWPPTDCHWLSVERQNLNDRRSTDFWLIVGRLSVDKSTDSRSIVGCESTDATYNTHDPSNSPLAEKGLKLWLQHTVILQYPQNALSPDVSDYLCENWEWEERKEGL